MDIIRFKINKLYKLSNYEIELKSNKLILIGENGSSKTTIIKILFYTLSTQWSKLSKYDFNNIEININDDNIKITKEDIDSILVIDERFLRRIPPRIRKELMNLSNLSETDNIEKINYLSRKYNISIDYPIDDELDLDENLISKSESYKKLMNITSRIKNHLEGTHIMYLPTYRRIEQELKVVLGGRIDDSEYRSRRVYTQNNNRNYTELVEFGMNDVIDSKDKTLNDLKDYFRNSLNQLTLGYLGDVVDEKYKLIDESYLNDIDDETITNIMRRVDENILSSELKNKLRGSIDKIKKTGSKTVHDKVVCHYFSKLLKSHKELEGKEVNMRNFVAVCTKYLKNKTIVYDNTNFTFSIISNIHQQSISFNQLSSGEKQIVSLFSHLYLDGDRKYFVLIDEPELSLSVKWQKQFLSDITKGEFCLGIVAVTHSPFIFDNELDSYAHAIEEFVKNKIR